VLKHRQDYPSLFQIVSSALLAGLLVYNQQVTIKNTYQSRLQSAKRLIRIKPLEETPEQAFKWSGSKYGAVQQDGSFVIDFDDYICAFEQTCLAGVKDNQTMLAHKT
jgi:hypothetical protein